MGNNLVTKAEYKSYVGISSPNQDAEIDLLIPKVSQLVKTYCRSSLIDNVDDLKVELFNGGESRLYLKETPVILLSSVEYSADYGQNYVDLVEFTDWVFDPNANAITSIGKSFPLLINGYKVSYNCGYGLIPEDLKLAAMDLVSYYRKNDSAVHGTKASNTNSMQIEYVMSTTLPAHIRRVLDQYVSDYS